MAISYKFSPETMDKLFGLELNIAEVSALNDFKVSCKASADGTKLEFGNASHGIVKDMPIKKGVLKMAKEGLLPVAAQEAAAKKIKAAFSITLKQLEKLPIKKASDAVWKDITDLDKKGAGDASNAPGIGIYKPADDIEAEEQMESTAFTEHMASAMLEDVDEEAPSPFKGQADLENLIDTHFDQADETVVFPEKDEAMHGAKITDVFPTDKDTALKMAKVKLSQATTMYQDINYSEQLSAAVITIRHLW